MKTFISVRTPRCLGFCALLQVLPVSSTLCASSDATQDESPVTAEQADAAPVWIAGVAQAPEMVPPFNTVLSAGDTFRVTPVDGRPCSFVMRNSGNGECSVVAIHFKDGKPTSFLSGNTVTLNAGDEVSMTFTKGPGEVDAYVVHALRGQVSVLADAKGGTGNSKPVEGVQEKQGDNSKSEDLEASAEQATASLVVPPSSEIAERIAIGWTGPGAKEDFISMARNRQHATAAPARSQVPDGATERPCGLPASLASMRCVMCRGKAPAFWHRGSSISRMSQPLFPRRER